MGAEQSTARRTARAIYGYAALTRLLNDNEVARGSLQARVEVEDKDRSAFLKRIGIGINWLAMAALTFSREELIIYIYGIGWHLPILFLLSDWDYLGFFVCHVRRLDYFMADNYNFMR